MSDDEAAEEDVNILMDLNSPSPSDVAEKLLAHYAASGSVSKDELTSLLSDHRDYVQQTSHSQSSTSETSSPKQHKHVDPAQEELEVREFAQGPFLEAFQNMPIWPEIEDTNILERMQPLTWDQPTDDLQNLSDDRSEQYTWDMCLVFDIGSDEKEVKVVTKLPASDEHPKGEKKKETMVESKHYLREMARIVRALRRAKLRVFCYKSVQKDEVYLLIGADEQRLATEAERVEIEVELDPHGTIAEGRKFEVDIALRTALPGEEEQEGKELGFELWDNLFGNFKDFKGSGDSREAIYMKHPEGPFHPNTPFRHVDRLKLTKSIVEAEQVLGGANLKLRGYVNAKAHPLTAMYALHKPPAADALKLNLLRCGAIFHPPADELRGYYGEQVAMYFSYLSFYTLWLFPPAITGMILFFLQLAVFKRIDIPGITGFAIAMAFWATSFLEAWKNKQAVLRMEWGMSNFLQKETDRPEFEGEWEVSPVTGQLEESFPFAKQLIRLIVSQSVVITMIIAVVAALVGLIVFRGILLRTLPGDFGLYGASFVNALVIMVFNKIYGAIASGLNNFENHRTDSMFENAMISKSFLFKFVNSYNSLFFIAFLKGTNSEVGYCKGSFRLFINAQTKVREEREMLVSGEYGWKFAWNDDPTACTYPTQICKIFTDYGIENFNKYPEGSVVADLERGDCLYELAFQLAIIFATQIFVNNFLEIMVPLVKRLLNARKQAATDVELTALAEEKGKSNGDLVSKPVMLVKSPAESEFELTDYEGTFSDYDEMVVQFGFVVLFVVAFPLAPMLALLNNVLENYLDAEKLHKYCRRPLPMGACDIGSWYGILDVVSWVALMTNVAMIIFATDMFPINPDKEAGRENDGSGFSVGETMLVFLVVEHSLFGLKALLAYFIPDEPDYVATHAARMKFITDILIGR